jgi:hypothetical protein
MSDAMLNGTVWLVCWLMSFTLTPRNKRDAGYNYFYQSINPSINQSTLY